MIDDVVITEVTTPVPPTPTPTPEPTTTPTPRKIPAVTPTPTPIPTPLFVVLDSGDYTGDGRADIAIFRAGGDTPVIGNFSGGFLDEPGVFRPSTSLWAIQGVTRVYYGTTGDIPVGR